MHGPVRQGPADNQSDAVQYTVVIGPRIQRTDEKDRKNKRTDKIEGRVGRFLSYEKLACKPVRHDKALTRGAVALSLLCSLSSA